MLKISKHPYRCDESQSPGRKKPITPDPYRNEYARDRDRILHAKSFRRLKHKTQVFLKPDEDHYRTRITHTLEVMQIARTIGRALGLNEDLIEAASLGHDLGHTPFGHAGERVLDRVIPGGFHHVRQSVRVVEYTDNNYQGLNLMPEVVDAIAKHSKGRGSIRGSESFRKNSTLEAQTVRVSDIIAYLNHDCDDAIRGGFISEKSLPKRILKELGPRANIRLDTFVHGIIESNLTHPVPELVIPDWIDTLLIEFRAFMYENVYENILVASKFHTPQMLIEKITRSYLDDRALFESDSDICASIPHFKDLSDAEQIPYIVDFVSGMTDIFAFKLGRKRGWLS